MQSQVWEPENNSQKGQVRKQPWDMKCLTHHSVTLPPGAVHMASDRTPGIPCGSQPALHAEPRRVCEMHGEASRAPSGFKTYFPHAQGIT